jgi:ubiquinone/menaquinone biosynthesis C-methylase UbiE
MMLRRALRFAFHLFYNPFAFTYDFVSALVSRGHWRTWTRAAIPRIRGTRVLEIPCGTGNLLVDLRAAGYAPIGVDLSASMLSITRGKVRARHSHRRSLESHPAGKIPNKISQDQDLANASPLLARARAQALPFPAALFDSVVMTFPPGFVSDPTAFAEIHRVLDDHGRLIWVDGARFVQPGLWSRLVNRWIGFVGGEADYERLMARVLERGGFEANIEWVGDDESIVAVAVATKRSVP